MTKYQVTDPQGVKHEFDGPDGATPDQVLAVAQRQFGQNTTDQPAPPPAMATPADRAFAAGREAGNDENAISAGVSQAAQQGTLGMQNYINAGVRYASQRLAGVQNPDDFSTDLAYSRGKSQGEAEGSPIASTIGGTTGAVMGGGALGSAAKGSRFARALAADTGSKMLNVAKSAGTGFTLGTGTALAQGQDLPQAAQTGAVTAALTPVGQKVVGYSLSKLQPVAQKAMQTLADTLGQSPKMLQDAYDSFVKVTGRLPSMAEITDLASQGKLKDLAKANPTIANAAMKAANYGNAPLHEQLQTLNNQAAIKPQSAAGINELRDTETSQFMNAPHPTTGVPLKDTLVNDPNGILQSPHVEYALRPNTKLNARMGQLNMNGESPILERINDNQATIGDIDTVRKALRDQQSGLSQPPVGSEHQRDPIMAKEFGDIANKVEGLGVRADKDYGRVLTNYRNAANYEQGFTHGLNGGSATDLPPDDSRLIKAFKTFHGNEGYDHGNALYTANEALRSIAPSAVRQPETGIGPGHVAQAAMAAASGGISSVYHGMRSLPVVGDRVPAAVQSKIAEMLFDPRRTQQGIDNLTRAGVESKDIRTLAATIGGATGQRMANYMSQGNQ
jgi:hypothetical protein